MYAIEASHLAEAWEHGQSQHPLHRALTLLRVAEPELSLDDLAVLSIGERDRRLVALRRRLFGPRFEAVASCPGCSEKLDLDFTSDQLPSEPPRQGVRLPNTADLLAVANDPPERRAAALLAICSGTELSPEEAAETERRMAEGDPMANVELRLVCPSCEHEWTALFDIASFLWTELNDWIVRLFNEVHTLARAYGWSEADILGMSARRRQVYLDQVASG
jgi:hypothetical protein